MPTVSCSVCDGSGWTGGGIQKSSCSCCGGSGSVYEEEQEDTRDHGDIKYDDRGNEI